MNTNLTFMKQLLYLFWMVLLSQPVFAQTIFWTGATDTDWGTGSNWSTNVPPAASDNVFVPVGLARYPVLNGNASIKSLAVQSGSLLTINAGRTLTISGAGVGYSIDLYGKIENNGTIAVNATSDAVYLNGNAQLNNNTGATLSVTTTGNYGVKFSISGVFTNQTGATATITGNSGSLLFSGANTPVEMVKNYGKMTLTKQIEKGSDTFHNYPCGVVILTEGEVYNDGGQIINEGFFSAPANLNGLAANFINDGIIYVDNFAPSYTNNAIRIYNNADATSIFGFGTSNNLTVAGIYKDDAATALAGDYNQATNTFTHFGLSAGSQTLYAKITRPGGTCPQIVPFTFVVSVASDFTTHPTHQTVCPGSPAVFTVTIASAASYQWQINTGSGWTNLSATSPYSNVTAATLNISNVTGLNGYQYRCVATGSGGVSIPSNAATLTISAGGGSSPTGVITWTGAVDTDWNSPCNWSPSSVPTATNDVVIPNTTNKPIIGTVAVAQTVEVQTGAALTISATKSLTINGSKLIEGSTSGLFNAGTVHNNGQLILGNISSVGELGLVSKGTFNNNTGAEITIDRATIGGLNNYTGGIFTNAAKITIGSNASVGSTGLNNLATFNNNTGGEITINRSNSIGLYNSVGSTFANAAKISIGTITPTMANGLFNHGNFSNNTGGEIAIDNTTAAGLVSGSGDLSIYPPGTFTNAGKITIGATALARIGLSNANGATFNNNAGGEIKIDRSTSKGLNNEGGTFNNAAKITIGASASVGNIGLHNQTAFNNNAGGEITIDRTTDTGLLNDIKGIFTNAAKITIGTTASIGNVGIYNLATFNNNAGEIKIDRSTQVGLSNNDNFTNAAKITIGALATVGDRGLVNDVGTFTNNTGGDITIKGITNGLTGIGLFNTVGSTFTNMAKITVDGAQYGIRNFNGSFQNNTNGEIKVDNSLRLGVFNESGTFTNLAKLSIKVLNSGSADGLTNRDIFNNSADGVLEIDGASGTYLVNQRGTFTNAAKIKLGGLSATEAINGIRNEDLFNNNLGGEITIINAEVGFVNSETLTNNALITISGRAETVGFRNGNLVTNNTCGKIILLNGMLLNRPGDTFTNRGFVQVTDNLTNEGIFTNNGVLKYGSLTGSVTNNTNPSLIVNNAPTPIFTYGGTYDGVINGIFTDAAATISAGTFTAPNTFVPSGLPVGTQTLYAKITPQGGACSYVVPFTYFNCNTTLTAGTLTNPTSCGGTNGSIAFTTTNLADGSYTLNYKKGTTAQMSNIMVAANTFTLSSLAQGSYAEFSITNADCTGSDATVKTLTDPNAPTISCIANILDNNTTGQCGKNITYNSTVTGAPMITYTFTGATTASGSGNGSGSFFNVGETMVTLTATNSCGTVRCSFTVTVFGLPTLTLGTIPAICTGATSFAIPYTGSTRTPIKYSIAGTGITAVTDATLPNSLITVNLSAPASGTSIAFTLTVKNADGCISANITGSVAVNPAPTLMAGTVTNPTTCGGTDGIISFTTTHLPNGSYSLNYTGAGSPKMISIVNNAFTLSGLSAGNYSNFSVTHNGCTAIFAPVQTLTNTLLPLVSITGPRTICTGQTTTLSPTSGGTWQSSNPSMASVTDEGIVTGLSVGVVYFTFTAAASCSASTANVTIKPTPTSALTASKVDVCPNTEVTLNANCSIPTANVNWSPGAPTVTPAAATLPYIYKASCTADGCTGNESRVEVRTHRILVDMKDLDVGALPLPIVRAVKDNMAPTNLINAPVFPRRWTFIANGCDASESAMFKLSGPVNFNTIDNASIYAMFANDAGGFYSLDHPNYGNGGSFPNGEYTLTVDLRSQDGVGGPFPKNRVATGALLATRTLQFNVVSPTSTREGVVDLSNLSPWKGLNPLPFAEVSPNPVSNTMRLKISEAKGQSVNVSLMDASGRMMLQRSFVPETNQHQEEFEVSQLANGMYFLRVNTENKNATLKVVKVD